MTRILIFGGYGFVGSSVYDYLKKKKIQTVRFTSLKEKSENYIKYNYKNFYNIINKNQPGIILFLSGNSNPHSSQNNYLYDLKKNNLILQNFLEAVKNSNYKGKIIYTSSIAVYGTNKQKTVKEHGTHLNPESYYAVSKIIAEKQCLFYTNKFKLNIIILRLCSIFGPTLKRQVIHDLMKKLFSNSKSVKMMGGMRDAREFLYIDDLTKIIFSILKSRNIKPGIYNIGGDKKIRIYDIIKFINEKFKLNKKVFFLNKFQYPKFAKLHTGKIKKIVKKIYINNFVNLQRVARQYNETK
jgi:UDP-glucose 4-epimerase